MSKFVMVVLPDERKAYQALHAIKALHDEGTVTYYGSAIVERKANGNLDVKQAADEGPLGFATGALLGGLVGMFGGPVGAAAGLAAGGMMGGVRDILHAGVSGDFLEKVTRDLLPGKFAVIAEISEEWTTPIDMKMDALGGKVVREERDEFVDDQMQKQIDEARSEFERRKARARDRLAQKKQEVSAKINALKAQADKADAEVQARIEKRIAEIRSDLAAREQKLNQAAELVKQAFHSEHAS
jgi:uncharacterized membrane protein